MYVESVSMTDFRCFAKAETTFVHPGTAGLPADALKNVTLLIGVNGAGKTSLLKALALGVLAPIHDGLGYRPYSLVRKDARPGDRVARVVVSYRLRNQDAEFKADRADLAAQSFSHELGIESYGTESSFHPPVVRSLLSGKPLLKSFHDAESPSFFLLGYGALRRTEHVENVDSKWSRARHPRFQRVAGLFDDAITLLPLASWFPSIPTKKRAKEVRECLNGLLPGTTQFTGTFQDNDALFDHNGIVLPFGALSDGFRSYVGLVSDMLNHLHKVAPEKAKLTDLAGVVMIDDIDVHLHPAWQREVLPRLAATFPKLQFIVTTHSPLVVGTVHAANVRVVEENEIREFTEATDGKSADQILVSSYFGLKSPRSPAKEKKLKRIAKRAAATHDPKAAVDFLKELTGTMTD
jgi:predicted ATPase